MPNEYVFLGKSVARRPSSEGRRMLSYESNSGRRRVSARAQHGGRGTIGWHIAQISGVSHAHDRFPPSMQSLESVVRVEKLMQRRHCVSRSNCRRLTPETLRRVRRVNSRYEVSLRDCCGFPGIVPQDHRVPNRVRTKYLASNVTVVMIAGRASEFNVGIFAEFWRARFWAACLITAMPSN